MTIFVSVSIAAAINLTGWRLFNSEGKQVFEITEFEDGDPNLTYSNITRKYEITMNEIQKDIPKGELKYFIAADIYEEVGGIALTMILNAEEIESVVEIPVELRESLHLRDELPNQLLIKSGSMYYKLPNRDLNLAEEMYKEAKEKGLAYITRDGKLTTHISSIDLHYESKSKK